MKKYFKTDLTVNKSFIHKAGYVNSLLKKRLDDENYQAFQNNLNSIDLAKDRTRQAYGFIAFLNKEIGRL